MQDSTPLPQQQPPDLNTTSTAPQLALDPPAAVSHEPIEFFRGWLRRIQEKKKEDTSGQLFTKYCETVPCPLDPLAYSEQTTYSEVVAKVVEYKSLFSSPHSVMVLQELQLSTVYVGASKQSCWMSSTGQTNSTTARGYDPELFCKHDRMVWAVGMTDSDGARQMENWGMKAVREVFSWSPQRDASSVEDRNIGPQKPNCCYFMPVYQSHGTERQFRERRAALTKDCKERRNTGKRCFADLCKRFAHPC